MNDVALEEMGKETAELVKSKIVSGYTPPLEEVNLIIDAAVQSGMDMTSTQAIVNVISSAQTQATTSVRAEVVPKSQEMRYMFNYLTASDQALFQSKEAELSNKVFMMSMRTVKVGHVNGAEKSWGHIRDTLLALHPDGLTFDGAEKLRLLRELKSHADQQKGHFVHGPKHFPESPGDLSRDYPLVYEQAYRGSDVPVPITDELTLCRSRSLMASGGVRCSHLSAGVTAPSKVKRDARDG